MKIPSLLQRSAAGVRISRPHGAGLAVLRCEFVAAARGARAGEVLASRRGRARGRAPGRQRQLCYAGAGRAGPAPKITLPGLRLESASGSRPAPHSFTWGAGRRPPGALTRLATDQLALGAGLPLGFFSVSESRLLPFSYCSAKYSLNVAGSKSRKVPPDSKCCMKTFPTA
jgi:hypothetical protein